MIRTAILGLGGIGRFYIHALQSNHNFQIIAQVDSDLKKNPTHSSLDHFFSEFSKDSLDLVIVALPNYLHFEVAKQSLEKGFHLIVEKPLTLKLKEAEELYELSLKKKLLLITFFHRRYNRAIQAFQPNSQPLCAHVSYLENISEHSLGQSWYTEPSKVGGGCLMDNGSNVLDILSCFFTSLKPVHVFLDNPDFENSCYVLLSHSRGYVSIELDWQYFGESKNVTFYLENGEKVAIDFLAPNPYDLRTKEFKGSLWHEYEVGMENFAQLFFKEDKPLESINKEGVVNLSFLLDLYAFSKLSYMSISPDEKNQ